MVMVTMCGLRFGCILLVLAAIAALIGCGTGGRSEPPGGEGPQSAAIPRAPQALTRRLTAADAALRRSISAASSSGRAPATHLSQAVTGPALYVQRAVRLLARRPGLEATTVPRLPSRLGSEVRSLTATLRDLDRLSAGWPSRRVVIGPPDPLDRLLRYYHRADRRFGVRWQILAAINLVESAFGRLRSRSIAGARGPMQFLPDTWRAYGLGGNINDPRDAILGAANLLRHDGAPADYAQALYAYNPSAAYVDATRRYAQLIARDRDVLYLLYSWRP